MPLHQHYGALSERQAHDPGMRIPLAAIRSVAGQKGENRVKTSKTPLLLAVGARRAPPLAELIQFARAGALDGLAAGKNIAIQILDLAQQGHQKRRAAAAGGGENACRKTSWRRDCSRARASQSPLSQSSAMDRVNAKASLNNAPLTGARDMLKPPARPGAAPFPPPCARPRGRWHPRRS